MKTLMTGFAVLVAVVGVAAGAGILIEWTMPTHNEDGSVLTDLAGSHLYYGISPSNYTHQVEILGGQPGAVRQYMLTGLVKRVYYFAVRAFNDDRVDSDFSEEANGKATNKPGKPINVGKVGL